VLRFLLSSRYIEQPDRPQLEQFESSKSPLRYSATISLKPSKYASTRKEACDKAGCTCRNGTPITHFDGERGALVYLSKNSEETRRSHLTDETDPIVRKAIIDEQNAKDEIKKLKNSGKEKQELLAIQAYLPLADLDSDELVVSDTISSERRRIQAQIRPHE